MRKVFLMGALAIAMALSFAIPAVAQNGNGPSVLSSVAGTYNARNYASWRNTIHVGGGGSINSGTGVSIPLRDPVVRLADGRTVNPYVAGVRVTIGAGSVAETVAITSASGCYLSASPGSCTIVVTTANQHGNGEPVTSGSIGLDEAIVDAASGGNGLPSPGGIFGGEVDIDPAWQVQGGTSLIVRATTVVYPQVVIKDTRQGGAVLYWPVQATATTVLGTPTTLTAVTALPSATPVGAYGTGTYHMCIAYVDILGQEGTCSADFSQAGLATGSFIFSPPAASAGAVGYTIYIGLTGGGVTNLDYKVPLVTQPTVLGALPVANGVCTLTTVESTTPACAIVNTTYSQAVGSTATVTAITLNTSPINPQTTVVSTTSIYVPNPGGRTTYGYVPGSHVGTPGIPAASPAFPITTAEATVVPDVAGTINISPGFMDYVGRTIELCGNITSTASVATIVDIQFQWDALGQNTAGKGVLIGDLTATPGVALVTGKATFCQDFQTTVASASATGGSINHIGGTGAVGGITLVAGGSFSDAMTAGAVASLNLAEDARINVIMLHTTATDGAGWILQGLTAKVIN